MRKNLIKLKKSRIESDGTEHWEAHIDPRNVRCIDPDVRDIDLICKYNLNSKYIAVIKKFHKPLRNGKHWMITPNFSGKPRYFEGCEDGECGVLLYRVKEIMNTVMRRAYENHEFGVMQDGILLNI